MYTLMTLYGPIESDARVLRTLGVFKKMGESVDLITCNSKPGFEMEGVRIRNLFVRYGLKGYIKFCYVCIRLFWNKRREIKLVYLNDYYSVIPGLLISLLFRNYPIIYDAHELILSDTRYPESRKNRFFAWFEKRLVCRVDKVVEANKERMELINARYSITNTDYVLNISETKYAPYRREISGNGQIRIVYQGVIAKSRNLIFFLECLKRLPNNYELVYIGDGDALPKLMEEAKVLGIENRVIFTGRLSNKDMLQHLSSCHIGIISYPFINYNNLFCSPNKIFEYAAMSLPFISTNQPFIKGIQNTYSIGRTFEYGDVDSFIKEIKILTGDYDIYTNGFGRFLADYSFSKEMDKLKRIIEDAANSRLC